MEIGILQVDCDAGERRLLPRFSAIGRRPRAKVVTCCNEVRDAGTSAVEAMFHAASQRMRSMPMAALAARSGLLPAAIASGVGGQVQWPLATVVVGGMLVAPIMLLIVVPALQTLFPGRESRVVCQK